MTKAFSTIVLVALGCQAASGAGPGPAEPATSGTTRAANADRAHEHHHEHGHSSPSGAAHDSSSGLHKDFSDAGAYSKRFDDPARDAWQKPAEVVRHMAIPRGSVVVDLGAGTGYFLRWLSEAVGPEGRVWALDVEANMVEFASQRAQREGLANVVARRVSTDDPELSSGSVARVLIVNTWHHIDQRALYAAKLREALAPDGELWVVDFTLDAKHGPPARHRLAPEQVVSELEAGGLQAEVIEPESLPDQYLVRARRAPSGDSR